MARDPLTAPLARADAERLLPRYSSARLSIEDRIMRGRCLRTMESWELAWNELSALRDKVKTPLQRARIGQDLLHLAYYVGAEIDVGTLYRAAMRDAGGDAVLVAEIEVAWSVHRLATANDATGALRAAQAALDSLRAAPADRDRDLVSVRVQRQLAHVLAQSGEYARAREAAEAALATSRKLRDEWEIAWSTYASGFADWCAGAVEESEQTLAHAEELVRPFGTNLWRWTVFCLARAKIEQGNLEEGDRLARQSGAGDVFERSYVALACHDVDVALQLVESAPSRERPFSDAVRGIVLARKGEIRPALRELEDARTAFAAFGLHHYAIGCAAHAAHVRESLAYGGGRERAIRVVREIGERGAHGFAWFLPEVAEWLGKVAVADERAAPVAKVLRARGETARRRGRSSMPAGASDVDGATAHLRMAGLTWRELDIVRRLSLQHREGEEVDREELAQRLGMSPNTLRVHLTRIRAKLDVGDRRGDEAILEAVRRLPAQEFGELRV
jgi:DNA-binding CsgD family transcriptional regulator